MAKTMPDFLVIGAPKAGTTSLNHYLSQHPQIFMSPNKEPHFFAFEGKQPNFQGPADDRAWLNTKSVVNLEGYQQLFDGSSADQRCGEASTMYLYIEESCDRIHHYCPQVKLIAFLRHPIERAYSHYKHMRRDGREWETDFGQALEKEAERIANGWSPAWHYRQVGMYCDQLQRYFDKFETGQLKVYLYDDLLQDPQGVYRSIFDFLEVSPTFEVDTSARYNTTSVVRKNKQLHDFLMNPSGLKTALSKIIPAHIRKPLSAKVYRRNAAPVEALSDSLRSELTASFTPEILRLQELINRDLSGWLNPVKQATGPSAKTPVSSAS